MLADELLSRETLDTLAAGAASADGQPLWPAASWQALCQAGVTGWCIPHTFGGSERDSRELLAGYAGLASACLTTCFLLSQRDAACRRLRDAENPEPAARLLPALARGETFATVGLAQLTTSRQHVRPVLVARPHGDGFLLEGSMPWVTGAARADHFITGAVLEDGRQVLLVVPGTAEGLSVGPPQELMALQGSLTASVTCQGVLVGRENVLTGPAEKVMTTGRSGTGGLETSCLALGLARAALDYLHQQAEARPEWRPPADRLEGIWQRLWQALLDAAAGCDSETASRLRGRANSLVLRITQTALVASKGTGFLLSHPAQRWARQAHFFLVWSCPRAAVDATLEDLLPPGSW
jgi:butyryl-CoA dehydrogenase